MSQEMPFRYFDRDVECIFKFFRKRFKLTFELQSEEVDGKDLDLGENNSRPSFASISQVSDSLDKELAASGFSKKDQENLEKFIEGSSMDSDSGEEANTDDDSVTDEASINHHQTLEQSNNGDLEKFDSLSLSKQESREQECDAVDSEQIPSTAPSSSEVQSASDEESDEEGDAELAKRLGKQRRRAIASAHRRQHLTSRNSYKDKGGKSSQNAKIQKQMGGW